MKKIVAYIIVLVTLCVPAYAQIEKIAVPCGKKLCFHWWPKLPAVKGWHHDREYSYEYNANAQAPDGYTFANAESVIYAKALYKPRNPGIKSLEMFIQNDKDNFTSGDANITVSAVDSVRTGDGQLLRSFTFFPKTKGNWEQVSYGEEGDYYLIFALSSRSKKGFLKCQHDYKEFINRYKKKP